MRPTAGTITLLLSVFSLLSPSTATSTSPLAVGPSAHEAADASLFERYVASHLRALRVHDTTPAKTTHSNSHLSHLSKLLSTAHSFSTAEVKKRKNRMAFQARFLGSSPALQKRAFDGQLVLPGQEEELLGAKMDDLDDVGPTAFVKRSGEGFVEDDGDSLTEVDYSWVSGDDGESDEEAGNGGDGSGQDEMLRKRSTIPEQPRMEIRRRDKKQESK